MSVRRLRWGAVATVLAVTPEASAQYTFYDDADAPNDVAGAFFSLTTTSFSPIPSVQDLAGSLGAVGRWTVGDLDQDGNPEVIGALSVLAETTELSVSTFDRATASYLDRGGVTLGGSTGRQVTGDLDGDGRPELVLAPFGGFPGPRPSGGGSSNVRVVKFDGLSPLATQSFTLTGQFLTRNSQLAVGNVAGDDTPELLVLTQNEIAQTSGGEPAGAGTLFVCTPALASPATCAEVFTLGIPASAGNRYPTSLAVGELDGDAGAEIVLGYGSACQTSDLGVSILHADTGVIQGPFPLARPFQKIALGDFDVDGRSELVATSGGQPGAGAGALSLYRFEAGAFALVAETPANVITRTCNPGPEPTVTFDPPALVGVVAPNAETANDGCNGEDDDNDGVVDENCLLRFLFIPTCYTGDDALFREQTTAHVEFFKQSLGLDACSDNVYVEQVPLADFHIAADCPADYVIGQYWQDIDRALDAVGESLDDWTLVVAFSNDDVFPATSDRIAGLTYPGIQRSAFVKQIPSSIFGTESGAEYRRIPEHIFSHEFGHQLGLGEEYVGSGGSLNPLEPRLGCDISDGSCCEIHTTGDECFLMGNRSRNGDGRCIMGHTDAQLNPNGPATPRDWCENCYHHLKQFEPIRRQLVAPLDCTSSFEGNGPIIRLTGSVGPDGRSLELAAETNPAGRLPLVAPHAGEFHLRVELDGGAIYEARFDARANAEPGDVSLPQAPPPDARASFKLFAPLPDGVLGTEPLPIVIAKDGVDVTRATLNGSAPVADAGPDRTVECNLPRAGSVMLDGTASSDADGDTLSYVWSGAELAFDDATSPTPLVTAPLGTHTVTLIVSDGLQSSAPDGATLSVRDTVPPAFPMLPLAQAAVCTRSDPVTLPIPKASDACDPAVEVTGRVIRSNGQSANVAIGSDGRATLSIGRHTVRWTARDASGNTVTTDQLLDVRPAFHASGSIDVSDRARVRAGSGYALVGNSGAGTSTFGVSSHTGEVLARGDVFLRNHARVHGSVTASGTLTKQLGALIEGQERPGTNPILPALPSPDVSFPPISGDLMVEPGTSLGAAPGSYGRAGVKQGATLRLTAGDYYFERLVLEPSSTVELDQSSGPIRLFVRFELVHRGAFTTLPANGGTFIRYVGTQASFLEAPFQGLLAAPHAQVVVRKPYSGEIAARDILLDPDVVFQCGVQAVVPFAAEVTLGGSTADPTRALAVQGEAAFPASPTSAASTSAASDAASETHEPGLSCSVRGPGAPRASGPLAFLLLVAGACAGRRKRRRDAAELARSG